MMTERTIGCVRMCGVDVELSEVAGLANENGDMLDGEFLHTEAKIRIRAGLSPTGRRDAVLHECIHAYLYLSGDDQWLCCLLGTKAARKLQEVICRKVAPGIAAFVDAGVMELVKL